MSVNYCVWFDREQLITGDSLATEIVKGIKDADTVICFITKNYVESENCRSEFF